MTRDKALLIIQRDAENVADLISNLKEGCSTAASLKERLDAYNMAVAALQAQPDGDRISRNYLLDAKPDCDVGWYCPMRDVIKAAPAVEPERKRGSWEKVITSRGAAKWSTKVCCSVCKTQGYKRCSYCPNCGAIMGEKKV